MLSYDSMERWIMEPTFFFFFSGLNKLNTNRSFQVLNEQAKTRQNKIRTLFNSQFKEKKNQTFKISNLVTNI